MTRIAWLYWNMIENTRGNKKKTKNNNKNILRVLTKLF